MKSSLSNLDVRYVPLKPAHAIQSFSAAAEKLNVLRLAAGWANLVRTLEEMGWEHHCSLVSTSGKCALIRTERR